MNRFRSSKATDETTWTAGICWIIFDEIPLDHRRLNLYDIQVILQPLLLGMNTDLISAFADQSFYLFNAHPILNSALDKCPLNSGWFKRRDLTFKRQYRALHGRLIHEL